MPGPDQKADLFFGEHCRTTADPCEVTQAIGQDFAGTIRMEHLTIRLGHHWVRFAQPSQELTFLGTVQQDASIGALACASDGSYWQVNGDHRSELDAAIVSPALATAQGLAGQIANARPEDTRTVHMSPYAHVPVTIKRKRVPVIPKG